MPKKEKEDIMNLNKKALATITLVILLVANGFSVFADEIDYTPEILFVKLKQDKK